VRNPYAINERTAISLSGGRTSAFMLNQVLQANDGLPKGTIVLFANTGKEMEETLEFVRDIQVNWNVPIVWVEYRDNEQGYEVVNFETASRNGEPFEALIKKRQYLPNPVTRFCTVELKIRAMHKHLKSLGWKDKGSAGWLQMVGIRADEQRRVAKIRNRPSPEVKLETMILPLANAGVTKRDVGDFWKTQSFDLKLFNNNGQTMHGNCDLCFLKGGDQVFSLIREKPERAVWWVKMEALALTLASKKDGAKFRKDRPSYQSMLNFSISQQDMFFGDEAIDCFCGDAA
jgi:3'-phosphoadenosine 5'-phosphosulfate sulfotransferase (PAPS reductase)/FAD synthetase